VAPVFRTKLADERRLSPADLVADLRARGRSARHFDSTAEIVSLVTAEARSGDLIVVMSNGGFDGIHEKLLEALRARA
jgi:UDP-N-acetylmuramate: L-alanyl-gamma-D-glutamyl-meso-diaminopimelate ligase